MEWIVALLSFLGGSGLTVFACQKIIGRYIDNKFKAREDENQLRLQRYGLIEKRLDVFATYIKRVNYGIRRYQDQFGHTCWNGEYDKAIEDFFAVEKEVDDFNRNLRNEKG